MDFTARFVQTNNPRFDVVNILPGVVLGHAELVKTRSGFQNNTNRFVIQAALGIDSQFPMVGCTAHVDDVAKLHVLSLDSKIPGNRNYMLCQDNKWSEVKGIVEKWFPAAVEKGILPCGGRQDTKPTRYDDSETDRVFGDKWLSFEDQVRSVIQSYLDAEDS